MVVAEAWMKEGQTRKALEIFRKVADLDPQNTEARIKLAQGYMSEGLTDDAATSYAEAGTQLLSRRKYERAIEAFTSALEIHPLDYTSLSGFLGAHIALGTPDEAAEVLERALAEKPEDAELLSMLANAYIEAEDAPSAERVMTSLAMTDSAHSIRFIEVARLYLKTGKVDEAVRVLSSITELLLSAREEETLMEILNEALARDPEHVEALRLLVRVYAWQRDDEKQRQALERLAEATEAAGLVEIERAALVQLAQFSPDRRYLDRLEALGHTQQQTEESSPAPGSTTEEIPSFESFALVNQETTASAMGLPPTEEVTEFEFNTVAEPATAPDPSASLPHARRAAVR